MTNNTSNSPAPAPAKAAAPSSKYATGAGSVVLGIVVDRLAEVDWAGFTTALVALAVSYVIPELNGEWLKRAASR